VGTAGAARRGARPRRVHRPDRAGIDSAIAGANGRQQGAGGQAAQRQAHDARRENQASRTDVVGADPRIRKVRKTEAPTSAPSESATQSLTAGLRLGTNAW